MRYYNTSLFFFLLLCTYKIPLPSDKNQNWQLTFLHKFFVLSFYQPLLFITEKEATLWQILLPFFIQQIWGAYRLQKTFVCFKKPFKMILRQIEGFLYFNRLCVEKTIPFSAVIELKYRSQCFCKSALCISKSYVHYNISDPVSIRIFNLFNIWFHLFFDRKRGINVYISYIYKSISVYFGFLYVFSFRHFSCSFWPSSEEKYSRICGSKQRAKDSTCHFEGLAFSRLWFSVFWQRLFHQNVSQNRDNHFL